MSSNHEIDTHSGVETTGHSWDGIKELNNPLPRWWLYTFYACIAFAAVYTVFYPAWPGLTGSSKGLLGWSSRADIRNELSVAEAAKASHIAQIKAAGITEILGNEDLRTFAVAAGASTFKVRCATCHGSGAQGGPGYPNLNDNSWLWGGKPEEILATIQHGVRATDDPETRTSLMPAFGKDQLLDAGQIESVAHFVRKISNQSTDEKLASDGAAIYTENCAACHGEKGEGNKEFGAPALNDAIWFYGGEFADIKKQINAPRAGMMPAWGPKLGDVATKELAVYVHSLGGGE